MATGRELLSGEKPHHPLTVWYHNAEDTQDMQQGRLAAVLSHHGIQHSELGGRLILTSGDDTPIQLARMGQSGPEETPGSKVWLIREVAQRGVEVLILDPLGAVHGLPENSNEAMNFLAGMLREIMARAKIAIVLLHHTPKAAGADMDAAGQNASRGASSLTDAARNVRQMRRMKDTEARAWGVSEAHHGDYVLVSNGKNTHFRARDGHWVRMVSVRLGNGTVDYPEGDSFQTVERWEPPKVQPGTTTELYRVQEAIKALPTPPQQNSQARNWVGWVIAEALDVDAGEHQPKDAQPKVAPTPEQAVVLTRIKRLLGGWINDGGLRVVAGTNPDTRKAAPCVGVGTPAFPLDEQGSAPEE